MKRPTLPTTTLTTVLLVLGVVLSSLQPWPLVRAQETPADIVQQATATPFQPQAEQLGSGTALAAPTNAGSDALPADPVQAAAPAPYSDISAQLAALRQADPQQSGSVAVNVIAQSTVRAGDLLTYTVLYTNTTSGAANEVWIDVALSPLGARPPIQAYQRTLVAPPETPDEQGVKSSEPITVTTDNYQWRVGSLAGNASGRIEFVVQVYWEKYVRSGVESTILGNTSKAYLGGRPGQGGAQSGSDNSGVLVVGPAFSLKKTAAPTDILAGQEVTYTITLGNATEPRDQISGKPRQDAITATNMLISDRIAANAELRRATPGFIFTDTTRLLTWVNTVPLRPLDTKVYTVVLRLAANASDCGSLNNSDIRVSSPEMPLRGASVERVEIPGQGASARIQEPIVIELTSPNSRPFANEQASIQISVKNYLPQALSGITVSAAVPARVINTGGVGTVEIDNTVGAVIWRNVSLTPGSLTTPSITRFSLTMQFGRVIGNHNTRVAVTVPPGTPIPPANIPIPQNCIRTRDLGIDVQPLIQLSKTVDKTLVEVGNEEFEYTLDVKNVSSQSVSGLVLTDTLPNHDRAIFIYKSSTAGPPPLVLNAASTTLGWSNLSVPPGQTVTLKFKVLGYGMAGAGGCYDNRLDADSLESQIRPWNGAVVCLKSPFEIDKTITPSNVDPQASGDARNVVVNISVREVYRPGIQGLPQTPLVFLKDDPQMNISLGGDPPTPDTELQFIRIISYTQSKNLSDTAILDTDGGVLWDSIGLNRVGDAFSVSMLFRVPGNPGEYQNRNFDDRACVGYRPSAFFGETGSPVDHTREFIYCIRDDASVILNRNTVRVGKDIDRQKVGLGERVRYTITVRNESKNVATGVSVSDTLPLNFRYDGMATQNLSPTFTISDGRHNMRWSGLTIQPDQEQRIEFYARVPDFIGRYQNEVWADSTMTSNKPVFLCRNEGADGCIYGPNALPIAARHIPGVDVEQRITIEPQVATTGLKPGGIVTYTISLVSNNNIPYQNTAVTATLPSDFQFLNMLDVGPQPTVVGTGKLNWRSITVPQASQSNGTYRLRFTARTPTRPGVYRLQVEASSPVGTIPTSDRSAVVVLGAISPTLSLAAPGLADISTTVQVAQSVINPDPTPLAVSALTTTLPAGLAFAGMVVSDTNQPQVTVLPNGGERLVWANLTLPATTNAENLAFISLDFRVRAPATAGTFTIASAITANRKVDTSGASVTIKVAKLRYMRMPLIRR